MREAAETRILVRVWQVVPENSSPAIRLVTGDEQTGNSPQNWPNARQVVVHPFSLPTGGRSQPSLSASIRPDRQQGSNVRTFAFNRQSVAETGCRQSFSPVCLEVHACF